jgi:hypothetical protein
VIGRLIDNLSELIFDKANVDSTFQSSIIANITDVLEKNQRDIDALIPKASAELE